MGALGFRVYRSGLIGFCRVFVIVCLELSASVSSALVVFISQLVIIFPSCSCASTSLCDTTSVVLSHLYHTARLRLRALGRALGPSRSGLAIKSTADTCS